MKESLPRLLRDELHRSLHGPAWHGPALLEALSSVTVDEAFDLPESGGHSIAQITMHAIAWMEEVERRLRGRPPAEPARGDWPPPGQRSQISWDAIRELVRVSGESLETAIAAFPLDKLFDTVGTGDPDAPLGSGVPYVVMINGMVQHNVYHAGQVVLLRNASRR
ncbi:DinB family protein [Gemmatimonas aurantiaca]|uniref:DinB family protein n=1 Tax=Gemmatimonas aurantiaca TaxID=173480 RepID=UPI00301E059B